MILMVLFEYSNGEQFSSVLVAIFHFPRRYDTRKLFDAVHDDDDDDDDDDDWA